MSESAKKRISVWSPFWTLTARGWIAGLLVGVVVAVVSGIDRSSCPWWFAALLWLLGTAIAGATEIKENRLRNRLPFD